MKTVRITETFDGFPNGKDEVRFTKGEEPTVSVAFADLIVGKGLAKEVAKPAPASKAETKATSKEANT
ncbi:hypothetical protein [Methylobacterium flocculans]|uniref:hypothetical protein n=1 Tax=Methylobacterium flocculans TaxID=2984843 RepID=UPI0021F2F577|nr:hypothetical protein [Methylobacterium sp. FF17]